MPRYCVPTSRYTTVRGPDNLVAADGGTLGAAAYYSGCPGFVLLLLGYFMLFVFNSIVPGSVCDTAQEIHHTYVVHTI